MDAAVAAAITAVPFADAGTAEQWFTAVCQTRDQCGADAGWDQFAAELAERAKADGFGDEIVERFTRHLTDLDPDPVATIGRMRDLADQLPAHYQELTAAEDPTAASAEQHDDQQWQAFLVAHGPQWNGSEETWTQFDQWFRYEADQRGLAVPAGRFIDHLAAQPDKVAVFAQYGVTIAGTGPSDEEAPAPDVSVYPEITAGESGAWVDYLDAMLRSKGF
ncbi:MAG: hypothetical protein GEV28_18675 [Actinophytocola sp.]|uniref:hypothetical protein n=1 Tax=Actinophytocola sp. TaxID=1872138 RepID=UPI00132A4439|nr:hypothetical protein [Actinophytocola sp.]MPZ82307.1 hypothetical protein [Actinophytocola sp.]